MSDAEERRVFTEHAISITSAILNTDPETLTDTKYFVAIEDCGIFTTLRAEFDRTTAELTINHDDCSVELTTIDRKNCEALKTVWDMNSGEVRPMKAGWDEANNMPDNNYIGDDSVSLYDKKATSCQYDYSYKVFEQALKVSR